MGNPLVRHLLRAGNELVVHDLRQESTANLIELGAVWAESPRAVAEQSDVVFTSLPGRRTSTPQFRDPMASLPARGPA